MFWEQPTDFVSQISNRKKKKLKKILINKLIDQPKNHLFFMRKHLMLLINNKGTIMSHNDNNLCPIHKSPTITISGIRPCRQYRHMTKLLIRLDEPSLSSR